MNKPQEQPPQEQEQRTPTSKNHHPHVIDDPVDVEPLGSDPVSVEALLQVVRVLLLHFVLVAAAVLQRGRLIHVHPADVVSVQGWMVHVQLRTDRQPVLGVHHSQILLNTVHDKVILIEVYTIHTFYEHGTRQTYIT